MNNLRNFLADNNIEPASFASEADSYHEISVFLFNLLHKSQHPGNPPSSYLTLLRSHQHHQIDVI